VVGHFCVNCGKTLVARVIEGREVEACPDDDFVLWHDPKVATAVVVETDGGVVLGRRGIEPGYGLWCLPGGFVNDDEDPARAAERECLEEIGATVEVTGLLGVQHIAKAGAPSMIAIAYRARLSGAVKPSAGSEMLEVGVYPLDALPPMAFSSHQRVLADYVRSTPRPATEPPPSAAAPARRGRRPSPSRGSPRRRRTP
jgi:8-oxo-dGTP diphosphatase